jgi:hypothetical protein
MPMKNFSDLTEREGWPWARYMDTPSANYSYKHL